MDAAEKLAKALNISVDQLLGTDGMLVAQAAEQYGARGAKQAQQLTDEVTGLFTGGELAQDDMDVMMQAIMDAYVFHCYSGARHRLGLYLVCTVQVQ